VCPEDGEEHTAPDTPCWAGDITMNKSPSEPIGKIKNINDEEFDLSWSKWIEPPEADYRLYFINVSHISWGQRTYKVFVTKKSYPDEESATHLATSYSLKEIKRRLDSANASGIPLILTPLTHEGWAMI
jgi:hypothetical protein